LTAFTLGVKPRGTRPAPPVETVLYLELSRRKPPTVIHPICCPDVPVGPKAGRGRPALTDRRPYQTQSRDSHAIGVASSLAVRIVRLTTAISLVSVRHVITCLSTRYQFCELCYP